jgi:hypothetical protein
MKESLFVSHVEIFQTRACLAMIPIGKPLMSKGAPCWYHIVLIYGEEVIEYRKNNSLKIYSTQ